MQRVSTYTTEAEKEYLFRDIIDRAYVFYDRFRNAQNRDTDWRESPYLRDFGRRITKIKEYTEHGEQIRCTAYLIREWNEESVQVRDRSTWFHSLRVEIELLIKMMKHKQMEVDLNRTWKITRVDHRGDYCDDLYFEVIPIAGGEANPIYEGEGIGNPSSTDQTHLNPRLRLTTLLANLQALIVPQKHEIVIIQ